MKIVVARRTSRIGEGLGYEIVPWAKGAIASEVLGARLVGPSWGLNRRRYYRNFRTSRLDVFAEEILKRLPNHRFTHEDYLESGEVDYGKALEKWATSRSILGRSSFIVEVGGPWGGFACLRHARPFILEKLYHSRDAVHNVYGVVSTLDRSKLFVAVHMRFGGDFRRQEKGEDVRGQFNLMIPGGWYLNACEAILSEFGDRVQFRFFTDRGGPEFDEAVRRFNPSQLPQAGLTECSDLLLMAQADLRVCSISMYSLTANYLSDGPYVWYEPQLWLDQGLYSLWGMDDTEKHPNSLTSQSARLMRQVEPGSDREGAFRGYAMKDDDRLPRGLVAQLRQKLLLKDRSANLVEYGSLPAWTRSQASLP